MAALDEEANKLMVPAEVEAQITTQKLIDIFHKTSRVSIKFRSYFSSYEQVMPKTAHPNNPVVVELGVLGGGSLEMWQQYFGPKAKIVGVDLNPKVKLRVGPDFDVFTANQHELASLVSVFEEIGPVDYLIDDGAHTNLSVFHTLCVAYAYVKPGGVLVVEDLHTSFEKSFGNPHKTSAFSIVQNLAKNMAGGISQPKKVSGSSFWEPLLGRISSIEFHNRMVAIRFSDDGRIVDNDTLLQNNSSEMRDSDLVDQRSLDDLPLYTRLQRFGKLRHKFRSVIPILRPGLRTYQTFRLWDRYRRMNRQITKAIKPSRAPGKDVNALMSSYLERCEFRV